MSNKDIQYAIVSAKLLMFKKYNVGVCSIIKAFGKKIIGLKDAQVLGLNDFVS